MKRKNLIIIICDQLRKDYLGCYGNPYVRTPNIDRIAADALCFDNCFVNNPICMPNRMSLFTGLYPHNHNQWTNGNQLEHTLPTLADYLAENGYSTASIGKIHFECTDCGANAPRISMEDHRLWKEKGDNIDWYGPYWGYQYVELTVGHSTAPIAHYGKWYHEHGGKDEWAKARVVDGFDACPVTVMPEKLHDSIFIGDRSADYIRNHANQEDPFFLVASFPDPHHPFQPPLETAKRYRNATVKMPINEEDDLLGRPRRYRYHKYGVWHRAGLLQPLEGMPEEDLAKCGKCADIIAEFMDESILAGLGLASHGDSTRKSHEPAPVSPHERNQRIRNTYAMIDLIDQGVGMILEALQETGALDDTVLVFLSDHGELMGDHGLWLKGPFFYDGLIKTPLIIRDPEHAAGKTSALTSSIDVFPTCCDLLHLPVPYRCDGVSQVPAFNGKEMRSECLIEYRNGYLSNDDYTLVYIDQQYKFSQDRNGEYEMTNRVNDPDESNNILSNGEHEELLNEYRNKTLQMLLSTPCRFPEQYCHA